MNYCLRNTTHRQFLSWIVYLEQKWNEPTLVCWYIMQLSRIVQGIFGKPDPLYKFKINFGGNKSKKKSKEEIEAEKAIATMQAKSRWFGIAGLFGKKPIETKVLKDSSKVE